MAQNTNGMTQEQLDQLEQQRAASQSDLRTKMQDPAYRAKYEAQMAQNWNDIQNHTGAYEGEAGGGWLENAVDSTMEFMIAATPYIVAVAVVAATAGAGSVALDAGVQAGDAVAAGTGMGTAVTDSVVGAAAADSAVAATVADAGTVVISGTAGGAAMTGADLLAGAGIATGAGAVASSIGSGGAAAQPATGATGSTGPQGPVPDAGQVVVSAPAPTPATGLPAGAGAGATVPVLGLPGPPNVQPNNPDADNQANQDIKDQEAKDPPMPSPSSGAGSGLPKIPNIPGTGGSGSGGSGVSGIGSLLGAGAIGAALDAFNSGNKDMVADPSLTGSINKLTSNADDEMAQWHNWMYPTLQGALADNKAETDRFVNTSHANADAMTGMAGQQRQAASDYLARNNSVYVPLADKIIADANAFNKQGYGQQQAGLAIGDLNAAYARQREADQQRMASYGVAPDSGRAMAMSSAAGVNNAANTAAAATRARMAAEELWGKKQMDALGTSTALNANMGTYANLNAGAGNLYAGANNVGNQAVNATSQYFTNADNLAKTAAGTYGTANNAYGTAGNLGLGLSKLENDRYIAEQQGRGQVLGAGLQALGGNNGVGSAVGNVIGNIGGGLWDAAKSWWGGDGSTDWNAIRNAGS